MSVVSGDLPGVDAADHVLSQEVGRRVARPGRFRHEQDDHAPHLKVVPVVVDKASAREQDTQTQKSYGCESSMELSKGFRKCSLNVSKIFTAPKDGTINRNIIKLQSELMQ